MRHALSVADRMLEAFHLGVILFCLTGWMIPHTRLLHLGLVAMIALSWFGLGAIFGIGYCPLTALQWRLRRLRGEMPPTTSFVGYQIRRLTGIRLDTGRANRLTRLAFYLSTAASLYVNL